MRPVRVVLAIATAFLACVGLLIGLLAVRLAAGPVRVDFLTPKIESAVRPRDGSLTVDIGTTEVLWGGWRERLDLHLRDLRLVWRDGRAATFASVSIELGMLALLRGAIEVTAITLVEPQVRLAWHGDGHAAVELSQPGGSSTASPEVPQALIAWLSADDPAMPLPSLRRVRVVRGGLVLDDQQHGLLVEVSGVQLEILRGGGEARLDLHALAHLRDQTVTLRAEARVGGTPRDASVRFAVGGLDPPGLADALGAAAAAPLSPPWRAVLAAVRVPMNAVADAAFDAAFRVTAVRVEVTGGAGTVLLPTQPPSEWPTSGLRLLGRWDATGDAGIDADLIDLTGRVLTVAASARGLTVAAAPPEVRLRFGGLNPHRLVSELRSSESAAVPTERGTLRWLAGLDSELAGDIEIAFADGPQPSGVRCRLTGSAGSVALTDLGAAAIPLARLEAAVRIDPAADQLELEALTIDLGGPALTATGRLTGLRAPTGLAAEAVLTAVPINAVGRMWPEKVATGVRSWLTTNLQDGRIARLATHIDGTFSAPAAASDTTTPAARFKGAQFGLGTLTGTVEFADTSVRYLATMPPVTGASGSATFTATGWDIRVPSAALEGLRVLDSSVRLSELGSSAPRIAIAGTVAGPVDKLLTVLDSPPLHLVQRTGDRLRSARGDVDGRISLDFPLQGPITFDTLGLAASAAVSRLEIPSVWGALGANDGSFAVTLKGREVRVAGRARLTDGEATVDWSETFPPTGAAERQLRVRASLAPADQAALGLDLSPWLQGPVGLQADFSGHGDWTGQLSAMADLTSARINVPALHVTKGAGEAGKAQARATLKSGQPGSLDPVSLDVPGFHVRGRALRGEERWRRIEASGTLAGAKAPAGVPADFTVSVVSAGEKEHMSLESEDVAALFRVLGFEVEGRGGQLQLTGVVDTSADFHPFDLQAQVLDFTWTKAPVLTRLFTLASLDGALKTFSSRGITFDKMVAHLSGDLRRIVLSDMSAVGSELGLTADGVIDRAAARLDLTGALVPAYYGLGAALGKVPVVRDFLPGKSDLGVFGVSFTVRGSLAQPDVSVDARRTLTPDIVQRLGAVLGEAGKR